MVQFTAKIEAEAGEKTIEIKDKVRELKDHHSCRPTRGLTPAHKTAKKPQGEGAESKVSDSQEVVGRLGQIHEHKWPVRFSGKTLLIQLADDAKITVEMTGTSVR